MITLIERAKSYVDQTCILAGSSTNTYSDLLANSEKIAQNLLSEVADLSEARVAFMVQPGFNYVAAQWGIWRAGGVVVPLCVSHPLNALQYTISDSEATVVIYEKEFSEILNPLFADSHIRYICLEDIFSADNQSLKDLPSVSEDRNAMILYTSGTTSLPKGVLTTHSNIKAQITSLIDAWQWSSSDHILCILPLHHVHGIINVIGCSLWAGAVLEFLPKFTAASVLEAFSRGKINLFMAVPTIYFKLIAHIESLPSDQAAALKEVMSKFRLMVSGSAALPVSVMEKWEKLSTHVLLERYGMTEIGMGISNPYLGERKAGYIGKALPGVQVRLCNEVDQEVQNEAGEIQIKGPTVFKAYFNKPEATSKAFTKDGWFKTGDIATVEDQYFKILGRDSVDIIKSGGYKISALEIEEVLRQYPGITDCSVIGLPNDEWGEVVAAVLTSSEENLDTEALSAWLKEQMPAYKTPRLFKLVSELPRNAMGKVTKNDLKSIFNT
jgi:malonyl-CoA/methylmalonyl-CoA synthetase